MTLFAPVSLLQSVDYRGGRYRDVVAFWYIESRESDYQPPYEQYILNYYAETATEELIKSYFRESEALRLKAWLSEFENENLFLMRPAPLVMNGDTTPLYCPWSNDKPILRIDGKPLYNLPFVVYAVLDFHFAKVRVTESALDELIRRRESEIYAANFEIENYRAMSERDFYIDRAELKTFENLLPDIADQDLFGPVKTATPCT